MTVSIAKSQEEIQHLPMVELAFELLKAKKEPIYFREIMAQIQAMRGMTEEQALEVIARLYTEINIDGRFICIGQNVWGLKRWYPVDKANERPTSKRFVRSSGDAFSDDDEELDDYEDVPDVDEEDEVSFLDPVAGKDDDDDSDDDTDDDFVEEAEEVDEFDESGEDDADFVDEDEEPLTEDEELEESDGEDDEERY